jgi:perosamine synthetase
MRLPYGRQLVDEGDIQAVSETLRSDWLTTGPEVRGFEEEVAMFTGASFAVAVSSGTAALHTAMHCLNIGPGDEVIVPAMTFVATANAVVFQGGRPVFADVDADTLLLNSEDVKAKITGRTKGIIAVDYAGQPCDYEALRKIAQDYGLFLVADACHSLGAELRGKRVGTLADLTVFSFHPVKHITTGEGGMVVTHREELAQKARRFRNHGIETDHRQREEQGTWLYDMVELGYNYRITDIQCALGRSQLKKLPAWLQRRRELAAHYFRLLQDLEWLTPLKAAVEGHAWHLYVVRLKRPEWRRPLFQFLRRREIGANVHYLPVHLHSFYRTRFGTGPGMCPVAEAAYEQILTLPLHQAMSLEQVEYVVNSLRAFETEAM